MCEAGIDHTHINLSKGQIYFKLLDIFYIFEELKF